MQHFRVFSVATALLLMIFVSACGAPATPTANTDNAPTAAPATDAEAAPTAMADTEAEPTAMTDTATEPTAMADTEAAPTAMADTNTEIINDALFEKLEAYDAASFSNPTTVDNKWFPLKPGTQYVYEGVTDENGEQIPHRVVFTVTDLTKVVDGVRTVVIWDQDYSNDELVETEIALFAQDDSGNVWHFGQYPEVYEEGKLVEAPAWIHGIEGAQAGITVKAEPQLGGPSYSQGWGPAVGWTDRARAAELEQNICVPLDCYENVLVTEEFSREEQNAFQLKYYAPNIGNIRVGWKGQDATQEILELVEIVDLSPEQLAEARAKALELEQRAYENSKDVYANTTPAE